MLSDWLFAICLSAGLTSLVLGLGGLTYLVMFPV